MKSSVRSFSSTPQRWTGGGGGGSKGETLTLIIKIIQQCTNNIEMVEMRRRDKSFLVFSLECMYCTFVI